MRTAAVRSLAVLCFVLVALPLTAATRTWTGTSSGSWSDPANWGGTAPSPGDDLVFPAGALHQTNTNDLASGTSFNSIAITGGTYTLDGNLLTIGAGGLSVSTSGNAINLPIALGATQTWTASGTASVTMAGVISGSAVITKTGSGSITFSGNNSYSGITTIHQGTLIVANANALGVEDGTAANGTVVDSGGSLSLLNVVLGNEAVSVTGQGESGNGALQNASCGNGTFTGPIAIDGSVKFSTCGTGGSLSFNAPISGIVPDFHLSGTSPFFFNAVNPFSGSMYIDELATPNVVNIGIKNAFSDVAIDIAPNQTLKLNDFNDLITAFSGHGNIDLGSGTLTVVGTNHTEFGGVISGTGNLIVAGDKSKVFSLRGSHNTAAGTFGNFGAGQLSIESSTWPGPVLSTGGQIIFTSRSVVGPLTVKSGASIACWMFDSTSGNLTLSAGSTLYASTFEPFLGHLEVNGTVDLGGATFDLGGYAHPPGTPYTIIENDGSDPIIGTFAGAPEGGTVFDGSLQEYTITYKGGDGNDVAVSVKRLATTTTLRSEWNPSESGETVRFMATITPWDPWNMTGTVTLFDGSKIVGYMPAYGGASFDLSNLAPGTHSMIAVYSGNTTYAPSTSAVFLQVVNPPPPPPPPPVPIPMLDPRALLLLAIVLAAGGALLLRR